VTYSEAVRYMMDQCDKHGLHHEVLSDFIHQVEQAFNLNEELCRAGEPQKPYNYGSMAYKALLEWGI
jgi:hypothetical protein